jgi:hydrogenase maturation protease
VKKRGILIGIGNPNFKDDGIGFQVVKALKGEVDAVHLLSPSLEMLERMFGYEKAVIVDGVKLGKKPGEIVELDLKPHEDKETFGGLTHSISLKEIITTGYAIFKEKMPQEVKLIGIEVESLTPFENSLSNAVQRALPKLIERIREFLL